MQSRNRDTDVEKILKDTKGVGRMDELGNFCIYGRRSYSASFWFFF